MSLIDSLLPNLDAILGIRDLLGVQIKNMFIRTRTWSGTVPGDGEATDITIPLLPSPQIVDLSHNLRLSEAGQVRGGDLMLKHISKNAFPDFNQVRAKSPSQNVEIFYQVGDDLFECISVVEKHLTWDVQIRRLSDQTKY